MRETNRSSENSSQPATQAKGSQRVNLGPPEPQNDFFEGLPSTAASAVDEVCDRFESEWLRGNVPNLEPYLELVTADFRTVLLRELILLDMSYRRRSQLPHIPEEYQRRFPKLDIEWLRHRIPPEFALTSMPAEMPKFEQLVDYEIEAEIGRGGMGVVYRAYDRELGRNVALKVLLPEMAQNPDRVRRFRREARAVSALNHPNICTIHAIKEWNGLPFLVLEWIEGVTVRAAMRAQQEINVLVPAIVQIARAIEVAHSNGIVHRDIKPENAIIRPDGLTKVLDFSLARLLDPHRAMVDLPEHETMTGAMMGTIPYMSPEQTRGETVGFESDIFSLGVMLYEVVTRKHPFASGAPAATIYAIGMHQPADPIQLNPAIDPRLSTLLMRMLEKVPGRRPAATEVSATLDSIALEEKISSWKLPSVPNRSSNRRPTVGRNRERTELLTAIESAAASRGSLQCVSGEAGIGKTTLVEEFVEELEESHGLIVATGRCSERLAGTEAYLPILDALSSLTSGLHRSLVTSTLTRVAPVWHALVNSTAEPSDASKSTAPVSPSQETLKRQFQAFLVELSAHRPILLFLDDVHWADASTADLLNYLGRDIDTLPLVVIVTFRSHELAFGNHPLRQVLFDLKGRGHCREIGLSFFEPDEVGQYVAVTYPQHRFPQEFIALLFKKTEGNPLFVVELLRLFEDRGVIREESPGWVLTAPLDDVEHEIPSSIRGVIEKKLSRLSDDELKLLRAASVQGYTFDAAVIGRAVRIDMADVEEQLDILGHKSGLIRPSYEWEMPDGTLTLRYHFIHVLYQNALFESLQPTRRASLAESVATNLCELHRAKSDVIASELAILWETARKWKSAVECYLVASAHACTLFAYTEALRLARSGLDLLPKLPEGNDRARLELKLLGTLVGPLVVTQGYASPEIVDTQNRILGSSNAVGDCELKAIATRQLHNFIRHSGDMKQSLDIALKFKAEAEQDQNLSVLVNAHMCLGLSFVHLGRVQESIGEFEAVLRLCDADIASAHEKHFALNPIPMALSLIGWGKCYLGDADSAIVVLRDAFAEFEAHVSSASERPSFTLIYVLFLSALVHQMRQEIPEVGKHVDQVVDFSRSLGNPFYEAIATSWQGWVLTQRGSPAEGLEMISRGQAACVSLGTGICQPQIYYMRAETLQRLNRLEEALAAADLGLNSVQVTGQGLYESDLQRMRGEILVGMPGRETEAIESFERALMIARERGFKIYALQAAMCLYRHRRETVDRIHAVRSLREAYEEITEGFGTQIVNEARELLAETDPDDAVVA